MVWAAMGVFGAVTSAVNNAWGVEKMPSYFRHKLISFVMLVASAVLLLGGLLLVTAINVVEASWFATVLERSPALLALQARDQVAPQPRPSSSLSASCSISSPTPRCASGTYGSAPW